MVDWFKIGGLLAVVAFLIFIGPLFTILALNTLFDLGIPVNFWTWLSAMWLGLMVYGQYSSK